MAGGDPDPVALRRYRGAIYLAARGRAIAEPGNRAENERTGRGLTTGACGLRISITGGGGKVKDLDAGGSLPGPAAFSCCSGRICFRTDSVSERVLTVIRSKLLLLLA
jgi:hypothetical protein